jgi:hypothetical protein
MTVNIASNFTGDTNLIVEDAALLDCEIDILEYFAYDPAAWTNVLKISSVSENIN